MNGLRQCALALHSLSAEDRAWMLEQLPEAQREAVEPLLQELRTLGISPELSDQQSALLELPVFPQHFEPVLSEFPCSPIEDASAMHMLALLRNEAPMLVARLLVSGNWTWRDKFLRKLPSQMRERVEIVGPLIDAPALTRALIAAVNRDLDLQEIRPASTAEAAPVWRGLLKKLAAPVTWLRQETLV